jgi:hypothetical protein
MRARRLNIQPFWNRLITAAAFMLTAVLSVPVAVESAEGRVASAAARHVEAAIKQGATVLSSERVEVFGAGHDSDDDNALDARPWQALAPVCDAGDQFCKTGRERPVEPLLTRAARSRAPPSI